MKLNIGILFALVLASTLTASWAEEPKAKEDVFLKAGASLKQRALPPRYDKCQFCHMKKQARYVPKAHQPKRQHDDHSLKHAGIEMSCNNCHDVTNSNFLRSTSQFPTSFANSSPVCERCHEEIFRDWREGVHGKRVGNWQGEKFQYHCIDCHDPHSVPFKPMKAIDAPRKPRLGVEKIEDEGEKRP